MASTMTENFLFRWIETARKPLHNMRWRNVW